MQNVAIKRVGFGVLAGLWQMAFAYELATSNIGFDTVIATATAYGTWLWSELWEKQELSREAIVPKSLLSAHDLKMARALLALSRNEFLTLLRDHDFGNVIHSTYVNKLHEFIDRLDRKIYFFQNDDVARDFRHFASALREFRDRLIVYGRTTGSQHQLITTKPAAMMDDEMRHRWRNEVSELNDLATEAHHRLDKFVDRLTAEFLDVADELLSPHGQQA